MHRSSGRRVRFVALCAMVAMGLVACGDDDDEAADTTTQPTTAAAPQASSSVSVDMTEMAFTISGPLSAGGTVKLANRGREFHVAAMGKLKPGRTMADIETALRESGPPGGGGGEQPTTSAGGATTTAARGSATTTTARGAATTTTTAGGGGGEEDNPLAEFADFIGPPGGFMSPGETADITVPNLGAGTYAFVCFIPSEGDGIPHFAKGMTGQMEVVEGGAPSTPTADATYKISPGRPVEGPTSLSAGRHTLKIEAAAGSDQLEPGLARLNPGTTFTQLDTALSTLFEGEEGPPPGSASRVPGQVVFSALDLGSSTTFYVTVDLRAGNYALVAEDTDPENRPRPPRELINITVG
jgi:hypothetical protein